MKNNYVKIRKFGQYYIFKLNIELSFELFATPVWTDYKSRYLLIINENNIHKLNKLHEIANNLTNKIICLPYEKSDEKNQFKLYVTSKIDLEMNKFTKIKLKLDSVFSSPIKSGYNFIVIS